MWPRRCAGRPDLPRRGRLVEELVLAIHPLRMLLADERLLETAVQELHANGCADLSSSLTVFVHCRPSQPWNPMGVSTLLLTDHPWFAARRVGASVDCQGATRRRMVTRGTD